MPPKQRFSSDDVINAAYSIVRRDGWQGLSARTIAKELNASTRPIYNHLQSMQKIEEAVVEKALADFVAFITRERTGDQWLDQALGYVLFAQAEKHLFRCINDEKHIPFQRKFSREHWAQLGDQLAGDDRFKDLPEESMNRIRSARWILLHGLAFLVSSGWVDLPEGEDSKLFRYLDMTVTDFLRRINHALYEEFK